MTQPIQFQSDQPYTVQLDSAIVTATWTVVRAMGGAGAAFEVRTVFVGDGAQIKIRGIGSEYGDLGGIDDTMFANRYCADFPIPADINVDEKITLAVELPRHGLSARTTAIPAIPPVILDSMQWGQQQARRGDIVALDARFTGLRETVDCIVHILEFDRDGNHDPICSISTVIRNGRMQLDWEYEYHEDTDEIPSEEELQEYGRHYNPPEYFFVVEIGGVRYGVEQESGVLEFRDFFRHKIVNKLNEPIPDQEYRLYTADGSMISGESDRDGVIYKPDIIPGTVILKV